VARLHTAQPKPGAPPVSNQINKHLKNLPTAVLAGARAVLPVFSTTPIPALYRESGFYPPEIKLDQIALKAITHLSQLDPYHPLWKRAKVIRLSGNPTSRFARRVLAQPYTEQVNPIVHPPWMAQETRETALALVGAPKGLTKEQAANRFQHFIQSISEKDIIIYFDGSKQENGLAGGSFVGYIAGLQVICSLSPLGPNKEIFDVEVIAALLGLKAAIQHLPSYTSFNIWVCLDNLEVVI
jgi:hypothetical protein